MADPNQNEPQQKPGNWNPNSGDWNQNPYGSQPPMYGQQGQQPQYGQQVDILAEEARSIYLEDALNGDVPGASGSVFTQNGPVTVGLSDVESSGPTLFYLNSDTSVSVEIIEFDTEDEARDAAQELGLL